MSLKSWPGVSYVTYTPDPLGLLNDLTMLSPFVCVAFGTARCGSNGNAAEPSPLSVVVQCRGYLPESQVSLYWVSGTASGWGAIPLGANRLEDHYLAIFDSGR